MYKYIAKKYDCFVIILGIHLADSYWKINQSVPFNSAEIA